MIFATSQPKKINTTCPYCGVGCGVEAQVGKQVSGDNTSDLANVIAVEGTKSHPANKGKLCVKGSALHETLAMQDRLLHPQINGEQASWDQALSVVAEKFKASIEEHGPDSVAFYLSGQLLTEDYYVANKLMKGFIGTANVDTNSRLCMASAVVGYKRAFGSDTVPCNYEDLETADLLVLIGSNAAWTHPILYQRMEAAKRARPEMKVVVIDPRRTATCDLADLHLAIKPGTDARLFNGLLHYLSDNGCLNKSYIEAHTEGFSEALDAAKSESVNELAAEIGVSMQDLKTFFSWYADTEKTISFYSQGINQSSSGTDKCNAIINCHLATGRIGKEGMGPFSITGQPNAMGGREVGGLANQLAAHMGFSEQEVDRVGRFWKAPQMATKPGLLAVDLFDAVDRGKIKAIWIMATNPIVSLPDADKVKRALENCDFVAVSECVKDSDTARVADVLLPALGWSEKSGTVTNSERRISRQPALISPSGEAKDDWWIICEVAKRMGWEKDFDFKDAREVFNEHAKLSAFENNNSRAFDISGLIDLSEQEYDQLEPVQWPVKQRDSSGRPIGTPRVFTDGRFFTASNKAQFIAITPRTPIAAPDAQYPFTLNTGRIRDQWHTMTRTGKAQRLSNHIASPYLSIHPDDAKLQGINDGDLVEVHNQFGRFRALAELDSGIQRENLFVPMHWTGENSSHGRMGALVNPHTDPLSGQPESKQTPVAIRTLNYRYWARFVSLENIEHLDADYWVKSRLDNGEGSLGYRYEMAFDRPPVWTDLISGCDKNQLEQVRYTDNARDIERVVFVDADIAVAALFVGRSKADLPPPDWMSELLNDKVDPLLLLSGRSSNTEDKGKIICSCFEIGEKQIIGAIASGACSIEDLGKSLRCGTNCGSCLPEIKGIIDKHLVTEAEAV